MAISTALHDRNNGTCELCNNEPATQSYLVSPRTDEIPANEVAVCDTCLSKMDEPGQGNHWRCLEGSIWSAEPAVQALSYRLLYSYREEQWASDVVSSVELDENTIQWALSAFEVAAVHKDAFGNTLDNGDTVVLTQNLNVKGTNFSAPKGTVVKKIRLVPDNTEQVEGKINGETIVILTKYLRKSV